MFVSKARHLAEVRRLKEMLELHLSAHAEIQAALEARIESLERLVFVPRAEPAREIYEADSVISASEKPVEMSEEERNLMLDGAREMELILSGNYDTDLYMGAE